MLIIKETAEVGGGYVEFYFLSGQFYKSKNILKYKVYYKNIEIWGFAK